MQLGVWCSHMVQEVMDSTVGEAPSAMSAVGAGFGHANAVELPECLGDRIWSGVHGSS